MRSLLVCFTLLTTSYVTLAAEELEIGYKGPDTPSCVDGTIYATSRASCNYPKVDIEAWILANPDRMEDLYRNVPVQVRRPKDGNFPNFVNGVESCDYVEDYPKLQWVYSFDNGWLPVVQTHRYRQFYRLEYCSSPQCTGSVDSNCKTFESRVQVLTWNGESVVGTTVLLQTSCKCVLNQEPSVGGGASDVGATGGACNPYTDCSCNCDPNDFQCLIHRKLVCPYYQLYPQGYNGWPVAQAPPVATAPLLPPPIVAPLAPQVPLSGYPIWTHHFHRRRRHHHHSSGSDYSDNRSRRRARSHSRSSRKSSHRSSQRSYSSSSSGSGGRSRGSREWRWGSACDPYTECSCPCGNWRTRRHCLDYRRHNNICGRETYNALDDWGHLPWWRGDMVEE